MLSWIKKLLVTFFGESIARALTGAGLAISVGALLTPVVTGGLNTVVTFAGRIPSNILQVMLLGGFGEVLSIVGSAMLTRLAMKSSALGLKKAAAVN
jgi:Protein of unknown function (DUF2523).